MKPDEDWRTGRVLKGQKLFTDTWQAPRRRKENTGIPPLSRHACRCLSEPGTPDTCLAFDFEMNTKWGTIFESAKKINKKGLEQEWTTKSEESVPPFKWRRLVTPEDVRIFDEHVWWQCLCRSQKSLIWCGKELYLRCLFIKSETIVIFFD